MSAFSYEAAKKTVMATADPVSSAYLGTRTAVATNATGTSGAKIQNWTAIRSMRSPSLPGRSPNGSTRLPRNCSAKTIETKPSRVSGDP